MNGQAMKASWKRELDASIRAWNDIRVERMRAESRFFQETLA
jgi:hypothetical protein